MPLAQGFAIRRGLRAGNADALLARCVGAGNRMIRLLPGWGRSFVPKVAATGTADRAPGWRREILRGDAVAGAAGRTGQDHRRPVPQSAGLGDAAHPWSRGDRRPVTSTQLAQMMIGIAEHRIDHRQPLEIMTALVLHLIPMPPCSWSVRGRRLIRV
ncbi:MAG TPA: hypothetical protein VMF05_12895 [Stellaceae bacterium]|nr:hypothetical protein [Stellaceae bacterium]